MTCWWASTRWTISAPEPLVQLSRGAGRLRFCGRSEAGNVYCWTLGDCGVLDHECELDALPVRLEHPATEIAGGTSHVCASGPGSVITCWGQNDHGQLGRRTEPGITRATVDWGDDALILMSPPRDTAD